MTESERKVERCDFVELNAMEEAGNKASVVRAGKQAVFRAGGGGRFGWICRKWGGGAER